MGGGGGIWRGSRRGLRGLGGLGGVEYCVGFRGCGFDLFIQRL